MSLFTYCVIDDEMPAIELLQSFMGPHTSWASAGYARDYEQGILLLKQQKPDLVFLDIQLGEATGFDILTQLQAIPEVVFVTAYDQWALKAFEVAALDYLLKPLDPGRLSDAVQKAAIKIQNNEAYLADKQPPDNAQYNIGQLQYEDPLFIKDNDRFVQLKVSDIFLIESVGSYARIYYKNTRVLILRTLNYLEDRLPKKYFFRANRSMIVNIDFVEYITPMPSNTLMVKLKNGTELDISQRQAVVFREKFRL